MNYIELNTDTADTARTALPPFTPLPRTSLPAGLTAVALERFQASSHMLIDAHLNAAEDSIVLGFRPEALELVGTDEAGTLPIRIDFVEELGSDSYLYGHLDGGGWVPVGQADDSTGSIVVRTPPRSDVREGELIHARVTPRGLHAFSASTGERI